MNVSKKVQKIFRAFFKDAMNDYNDLDIESDNKFRKKLKNLNLQVIIII